MCKLRLTNNLWINVPPENLRGKLKKNHWEQSLTKKHKFQPPSTEMRSKKFSAPKEHRMTKGIVLDQRNRSHEQF